MCTVLLPPDGYPIAVNKYIISCFSVNTPSSGSLQVVLAEVMNY